MRRPLFLPTARQTNWLLIVAFLALGQAMYLRYHVMENSTVSLACQGGLATWLCDAFRLVNLLYPYQVFGSAAASVFQVFLHEPVGVGLGNGVARGVGVGLVVATRSGSELVNWPVAGL